MLIPRFFSKNFVFFLVIISLLTVSHIQGQTQEGQNQPKLNNFTLNKIYEENSKVIFKDKLFDELNNIRVNQGILALKKKLLEYKNKIAYGILRFENDKESLKKNNLNLNKYDQSVWILVYSYELHPESMLAFIDLSRDGYTYDNADLSIDEVAYITPTSFRILPILAESDKSVIFFVPYTAKNGRRMQKKIEVSHGVVESKYYFFYKQAINCIKHPYAFRPFKGSLITFSSECIIPKKKTVTPIEATVLEVPLSDNLDVEIPTSDDPNVKTVLISNPDKPIYKRLSCVGVGKLGNKCVIYNANSWKSFK